MAQSKQQIQQILSDANTQPRHRFGQNFMIDQNLVRLIADAGEIGAEDLIIEVGPGTGTLTEELLSRGAQVTAVEIDRDLAESLRTRLAGNEKFALIEGDALAGKHAINEQLAKLIVDTRALGRPVKLVANLPYNIASPLVIELLICGVDLLVFVVQKEVADRLKARENTDDFGPLTVMAQMLAKVEVMRKLPPGAFWPPPSIDSSLVKMNRADRLGEAAAAFSVFVHKVFSSRRKTLRKALSQADLDAEKILATTGLDGSRRAEELAPETFWRMYRASLQ